MNKGTTYEVPSSFPTFDIKSGVSINKNNLTTQVQAQASTSTITPIIIQLPLQFYQNSSQEQTISHIPNNTNTHLTLSPNTNH